MSCPSSEMLVAAAEPDAPRDVRETVADHLVTCPRCAEEFRVLSEVGPWAADHAHLLGESARPGVTPARSTKFQTGRGLRLGSPWAYATAAVLVLAVAALEVQVQRLQRDNQALAVRAEAAAAALSAATPATSPSGASSSPSLEARVADQQRTIEDLERRLQASDVPELNAPIIDLVPADAQRSATATPSAPVIPAGARSIVFILNTTHAEPGASYDVDLAGANNRVLWTGSGLKQSADRTLTLVVPRALVRDATSVRLYSRAGTRRTLVEQFAIPALRE
jgi:hypothetical protein